MSIRFAGLDVVRCKDTSKEDADTTVNPIPSIYLQPQSLSFKLSNYVDIFGSSKFKFLQPVSPWFLVGNAVLDP